MLMIAKTAKARKVKVLYAAATEEVTDVMTGFMKMLKCVGEYNFYGGDVFDKSKCLLDPYAKLVSGRNVWGVEPDYRSKIILDNFDREGDVPLKTPHNELIIYEAHVSGFTKDESSGRPSRVRGRARN